MTAQVRTDTRLPPPLSMRSRLRLSCGLAALAAAVAVATPQQVKAQAFQGNETVVAGIANRTITSTTSETITVGSPTATINWSPYDTQGTGTINFLPSGHTATFTNDPNSTADFTVLNRIIPLDTSRPISLNGNVISQLQDLSGNVTRGGNVWFYSPGGIMIGATAVFDVGGLLLTVNDPISWSTTSTGFSGRFTSSSTSNAQVNIASGAQINALANNSYVALVAPRVEQHGSIRVDGTAALVAGQDVSLTMNQGLFDIRVNVGTDDPNGVVHTGSTGGPSSSGAGDNHRVYMVAVPKNQALTMLLSGDVGFDAASSASVQDGEIFLGSGVSVFDADGVRASAEHDGVNAGINIGTGSYSSAVVAMARGDIIANATSGSIDFAGDVSLFSAGSAGGGNAQLGAINGHSLSVGGFAIIGAKTEALVHASGGGTVEITGGASVSASRLGFNGTTAQGGIAAIEADGGSIAIGGPTFVSADGLSIAPFGSSSSSDSVGGQASLLAINGGTISTGDLTASANGTGQDNAGGGDTVSGDGTGGRVDIRVDTGGHIAVSGNLTASADGTGGNMLTGSTAGGVGTGGTISLTADSGAVTVAGTTTLTANGTGGSPAEGATGTQAGGAGTGGRVEVLAQGTGQLTLQNTLRASAFGIGGNGLGDGAGGNGTGGHARVAVSGGSLEVDGSTIIQTNGTGGSGQDGGNGNGGHSTLTATDGGTLALAGDAIVQSHGTGGSGSSTGEAGTGTGGTAEMILNGGSASIGGNFLLTAHAFGSQGGRGGDAVANVARVEVGSGGGSLTVTGITQIWAIGYAGSGTSVAGGDGYGGSASLHVTSDLAPEATASLTFDGISIDAGTFAGDGAADSGATGGTGRAGSASLFLGAGTMQTQRLAVVSGGWGGDGGSIAEGAGGAGGVGHGGNTSLTVHGTLTSSSYLGWSRGNGGHGGAGTTAGAGGAASGGNGSVEVASTGQFDVSGQLAINAGAIGGNGASGGAALAGNANVSVMGALSTDSITLNSSGTGGAGSSGTGGEGRGGSTLLVASGGDITVAGIVDASANGAGGSAVGGSGGNGTGGLAQIYAQDATLSFASATVSTNGIGGNGAVGGRGTGGSAPAFDSSAPTAGSFLSVRNGSILGTDLTVSSTGTGGAGAAGAGGHGVGGLASVVALNGTTTGLIDVDNVTVDASAAGGAGGAGANGGIGQAGGAYLLARAVNGALVVDAATMRATGAGGAGGLGISGGTGGAGGAGYGGVTEFGTSSGQITTSDREGVATFGTINADASGSGGAGGAGDSSGAGGAGGVGIGGRGTLLARGSRVNATAVGIVANGTGGLGGLDGSGATRAAAGIGIGGDAGLLATNIFQGTDPSTVVVGSLTATASGIAADSSAATQAGGVLIEAISSAVQLGTVNMTAAGAGPRNFTGTSAFGNSFTLSPLQSGVIAGNATVHVTGNGQITSGDAITLRANPGGLLDVDGNLTLTSGGTIGILAVGDGQINVDGTLSATTLAGADGAGDDISVSHHTSAEDTTQPAGRTTLTAGAIVLNSANDIELEGSSINVARTAQLTFADDIGFGDFSAGESINARLAPVLATDTDEYLAEISGLVVAPIITLEAGAIEIEQGGQLGQAGVTQSLELIARSFGQPVIVGGVEQDPDATGGQYHLSQAEAERIEAAAVTFRATSATAQSPQVVVRDLTIQGSAGGGTSSVRLITPGSVRVEGDLAYIDAAATDALTISADERLEVITPDGSIRMVAPDGGLAGVLTLQSSNIVVTDAALAARLAQDPNFEGRDEALATNNGPVNEAGYLEADGIRLLTGENIFIQNSGTATEFAGLTVGGQGLLVGRYQASTNPDGTQSFSFVGTLTTADDVLLFDFTITSETRITLRTYSYAGGVNGAGETIPAGGFDPILALFNAAGTLIDQNDDGGSDNVPADPTTGRHYDTFLQAMLPAGTYTVAVTAYSNFPAGTNLSDGFRGGGNFNGRTPNFAFDVIGADLATGPGDSGPITVVAFGRMQNADGSFTGGADFFTAVDFGIESGVQYAEGSTFNSFAIGQPVPQPPLPEPPQPPQPPQPPTAPPPPPGTNPQTVLGPVELIVSETGTDPEDESDASGTGVSTSTSLVSTGPGVVEGLLDEAVTSGGDTSQWIDDEEDEDCEPGDERQQCQERTN